MRKLWNKLMEVLPMVWGILLIALITGGLVTCMIAIIKWLLALLGVL